MKTKRLRSTPPLAHFIQTDSESFLSRTLRFHNGAWPAEWSVYALLKKIGRVADESACFCGSAV
jgi:hypothetical protein